MLTWSVQTHRDGAHSSSTLPCMCSQPSISTLRHPRRRWMDARTVRGLSNLPPRDLESGRQRRGVLHDGISRWVAWCFVADMDCSELSKRRGHGLRPAVLNQAPGGGHLGNRQQHRPKGVWNALRRHGRTRRHSSRVESRPMPCEYLTYPQAFRRSPAVSRL